jgi:peroxiredoxin
LVLLGAQLLCFAIFSHAETSLLNKRAPDFARADLRKSQVHLAAFRGKVVLLNFWATWCAPCLNEMPRFVRWQTHYGQGGFQVLGVSMDDDSSPVSPLVQKLHVNYPIVMGDEKLGDLYGGVLGLPVTYLIDRTGVIRARFQGEADLDKIEVQLKALLADSPPAPGHR